MGPYCAACLQGLPWIECPCPRCGLDLGSARVVRHDSRRQLPSWRCDRCSGETYAFDGARAALRYEGLVRSAVVRFKFQRDLELLDVLCDWVVRTAQDRSWTAVLRDVRRRGALVPVPTHWWTRARRGWDPARVLTSAVGARLEIPVLHALRKTCSSVPQTRLGRSQRRANLRGAFSLLPGVEIPPRVVILDDVLTTGTTVSRCAEVLRRGGARDVTVLSVARS